MKTFSSKGFVFAICVCLILNLNVASAESEEEVRDFLNYIDIATGFPSC